MELGGSSEIHFKAIVESFQDVIMRFDKQHRHLYVNKAAEELTGILRDDFIGKTHEELGFPKDLCTLWENAINHVFDTGKSNRIEFELPNGVVIDWLMTPEIDKDGHFNTILTTSRDITQIRNSEKKLIDNQNRFSDAFQLARITSWEMDLDKYSIILNDVLSNLLGIPYNEDDPYITNKDYINNFVHPDDKVYFINKLENADRLRSESYQDIFNYRIINTKGGVLWIRTTVRFGFDKHGNAITAYGTFQDITTIKKTEEELAAHKLHLEDIVEQRTFELQQSENKLQDALDLAKLSTWQFDINTETLTFSGILDNKLEKERFGNGNKLKLESFVKSIHPDDFKFFHDGIEKAMRATDKEYNDIMNIRMYNSEKIVQNMNITVKVNFDENNTPYQLFGTIQDVTYLEESKNEKDKLISIIEATSDIVIMANVEKNITYINKAGKVFFGFADNEELSNISITTLYSVVNSRRLYAIFKQVDKGEHWIGESKIRKYDKTIVPVSEVILVHKNYLNEINCYSITFRNLSKQKQIENDLIDKNKELDTFVYRASHDLRGPIASLLGLYNVAKHEVSDATALSFFDMYNNQILRLNETIIALIELTKIKEQKIKNETVNIEDIVQGSISYFTHSQGFDDIQFNINIKLDTNIYSDKSLITTIIQNLIENAIKYSRSDVKPFVDIKIFLRKNSLFIIVEDNGIGIEKSIQNKIFDMFFRASTQAIGSGLGLYILKNAVEKLKGGVTLRSVLNEGSTFVVEIPYKN
ncbi:MAG: PAS domain S-box protein [Cyclobacteriaceae bacterium]|nr:PAS domain S-box protein [Cyclobacteriaceae bacterium]